MVLETQFYDILSILPTATTEEISRAFKKLALKCHPDKTNHDPHLTEKFKQLTRAYEVLRDDQLRTVYDKYGEAGLEGNGGGNNGNPPLTTGVRPGNFKFRSARDVFSQVFNDMNHQFSEFDNFPFNNMASFGNLTSFGNMASFPDMTFPNVGFPPNRTSGMNNMSSMAGNMSKTVRPAPMKPEKVYKGKDIFHTCKLTLEELSHGKIVKLQLPRRTKCDKCHGIGGFNQSLCKTCQGSGRIIITMANQFTKFQEIGLCKDCSGTGSTITSICNQCDDGYLIINKIIELTVLPGTNCGEEIILKEAADEGKNIIPGDVIIKIKQKPHDYLIRKFNDLYTEYNIDLKTALLGGSIILKNYLKLGEDLRIFINVHGNATLNNQLHQLVHQGEVVGAINPGNPKIVKGLGMPINHNDIDGVYYQTNDVKINDINHYKRGDLFIKFNVELPNIDEFNEQDLTILTKVLPSKPQEVNDDNDNIMDSHLSNLPNFNPPAPSNFNRKEGSFSSSGSNDSSSFEPDTKRPKFT